MKRTLLIISILSVLGSAVHAQPELLTNASIIEMSKAGLNPQLITAKMSATAGSYDISAAALIALKTAGVEDEVIALMIEKAKATPASSSTAANAEDRTSVRAEIPTQPITAPQLASRPNPIEPLPAPLTPKQALLTAKTISFEKSSLQPSSQALEKELLKRPDWRALNLTIVRYKNQADLYAEIGFVHGSILTHRYVYRIYDRRTGAVLAAGETTSWGSLAENLARHIAKSLARIRNQPGP